MASYHLHRDDSTGNWSCGGPYKDMKHAADDAKRIIEVREKLGETWYLVPGKHGELSAWENNRGDRMYVKDN